MATKTWKIEKDLCRCCHAEGTFDNLAEPRIFLEKEEIYSDMLRECLDIDIPPVPGELCAITYTICSTCITRLRDACNFKKQVQDCEQRFMTLYYKNAIQGIKPETIVKEEFDVTIEDGNSEGDIECIVKKEDDDDDDDDDDDVGITGAGDDDDDSDDYCIKRTRSSTKATPKATPKAKPKAKPKAPVKKEKPSPQAKKKPEPKAVKEKKGQHVYTHIEGKFVCSFCNKPFDKKKNCADHYRRVHLDKKKADNDVGSRLRCPYCPEMMFQHKIRQHLREVHKVLPDAYLYTEKEGGYLCNICGKPFTVKKHCLEHYRNVHLKLRRVKETQCPHCPEMVLRHRKHLHLEQAHNIQPPTCGVCERTFCSQHAAQQHTRRVHMKERNVVCKTCGLACFNEGRLKIHERSHSDERQFECNVCGKRFRWKSNLTTHVMIHSKDKRKKCTVCGERFVQKASLNYHMMKHHPEVPF